MPSILIIDPDRTPSNWSLVQKMVPCARLKSFETSILAQPVDIVGSLRREHAYDVISILTTRQTERALLADVIALLRDIDYCGVLVHYWGYNHFGKMPQDTLFHFTELMQQCCGSPESPLVEWWADHCLIAYKDHIKSLAVP